MTSTCRALTPRTRLSVLVARGVTALALVPALALGIAPSAGAVENAPRLAAGAAAAHTNRHAASAAKALAARKLAAKKAAAHARSLFDNNSYPYASAAPTGGDTLNMGVRQCTSYAAWALTREGVALTADPIGGADLTGPDGTAQLGDARTWAAAARSAGYAVNSTPTVGAIAEWNANEKSTWSTSVDGQPGGWLQAGPEGHVGVVVAVNSDGTAVVRDYNGWVSVGYSQHTEKAPRYLHIAA